MTPHNQTQTLAHLATLLALALDAHQTGEKWALLAWVERISADATMLADDLLDELRLEMERERRASDDQRS